MASSPASNDTGAKHFEAAEIIITSITDDATHTRDNVHMPADQEKAHSWFRAVFRYESLEDFENQWHLGNYVMDRQTKQKSFEPMSIYVRLGMHLLYYGSHQENILQWKRAQDLLKSQSVKMGKQYDSPASKDHIQPFIDSFDLQDTLQELVRLCI